jgi:flavin reductase
MSDPTDGKKRYREAMSRLGAAVNIITTHGDDGDAGFTASAVCSVTDEPATLLLCINRTAKLNPTIKRNGNFCVNVLAPEHQELAPIFAGVGDVPMPARFAAASWLRLTTGAPVLASSTANFDCTIDQITEVGTHSVIFGRVVNIRIGPVASGIVYHNRGYHHLLEKSLTKTQ